MRKLARSVVVLLAVTLLAATHAPFAPVTAAVADTASAGGDDPSEILRDIPSLEQARARVGPDWVQIRGTPFPVTADGRVDWSDPDGRGRSYQRQVHGLRMVRYLAVLAAHGDPGAADRALAVTRSWVAHNPRHAPAHPMAWHDETTALRLHSIINLHVTLRTIGGDPADLRWLEQRAEEHVHVLLDDDFHSAGTNHGMFQDRAILTWVVDPVSAPADRQLVIDADRVATRRLIDYFDVIFSPSGVHLEHSPAYHKIVLRNLDRIVRAYHANGQSGVAAPLAAIRERAGHYATHVIQPNGLMPEVADTSTAGSVPHPGLVDTDAYRYAVSAGAEGTPPIEVDAFYLDADTAVMRDAWQPGGRGTYLHFTAAYHVNYHKHPDDLSLWLYHDGDLLTEAGMNGYLYHDPFTVYGYSAAAHNTVLVDGVGVNRTDGQFDRVWMIGARGDGNMSVVAGRTERFPGDRAVWERTVRYDRAAATVEVVDAVTAARPGAEATVLWHTAPEIDVRLTDRHAHLYRHGRLTARMQVADLHGNLPLQTVSGQTDPLLGWRLGQGTPQPTEVLLARTTDAGAITTSIDLLRPPPLRDIAEVCATSQQPFVDVTGTHAPAVACLHQLGIARGVGDGELFVPAAAVRRDQMASFVARTLTHAGVELPTDDLPTFADVPPGHRHGTAISQLAAVGVVTGNAAGSYLPDAPIDRGQMATMLDRAAAVVSGPLPDGSRWFDDAIGTHGASIDRLTEAGITAGAAAGGYQPSGQVTRGQMATFLARTLAALAQDGAEITRP